MSPPALPTDDLADMDRVLSWPLWRGLTIKLRTVTLLVGTSGTYKHEDMNNIKAFWEKGRCRVRLERMNIERGVWVRIAIGRPAREAYLAARGGQALQLPLDYPRVNHMLVENVPTFQWVLRELAALKSVCDQF